MDKQEHRASPVTLFYSYAPEDEEFREYLEKHLSVLHRNGSISSWHHQQILAGSDRTQAMNSNLDAASIILLLISPDFIASDYYYSVEMRIALERAASGKSRVIPVLLRPVLFEETPFAHLQLLPHNGKPVISWDNQDQAFYDIAVSIHTIVEDIRNHASRSPLQRRVKPLPITPKEKTRQCLLERVHDIWIAGMLEKSLLQTTLIVPGLREQSDTIMNPWHLTVQETDRPSRLLPASTHITQVYNDARGELLILGEPGSGKTTLLLDLTRDLLRLAERDPTQPIPLVCNLSSWAEKCLPLSTWVIEELQTKYNIPLALGKELVYNGQFILLLDGLDEVAEKQRIACITTINAHRQEYHLIPTVVCCRKADYEALDTPLALYRSVVIQPLNTSQIDEYLEAAGKNGAMVHKMLRDDPELRELATTPLMLNILLHAYQGKTSGDLTIFHDKDKKQRQIFSIYVKNALKRRWDDKHYSAQQTEYWMKQLAQYMHKQNQSTFYLEQIRADWLSIGQWQQIYELVGVRLLDALIGAVVSLLIVNILSNTIIPLLSALPYIVFGCLLGVLLSRRRRVFTTVVEIDVKARYAFLSRFMQKKHLSCGLLVGLSYGLIYGLGYELRIGLIYGIVFSLVSIVLSVFFENSKFLSSSTRLPIWLWSHLPGKYIHSDFLWIGLRSGSIYASGYIVSTEIVHYLQVKPGYLFAFTLVYILNFTLIGILINAIFSIRKPLIEPAEKIHWSWTRFWSSLISRSSLLTMLLIGLLVGATSWLIFWLLQPDFALRFGLNAGVVFSFNYWLLFALFKGLSHTILDEDDRRRPNEGIRRSGRNAVLVGLSTGLVSLLISSTSYGLADMILYGWRHSLLVALYIGGGLGLFIGLSVGLLCVFLNGGIAYIQHYILRLLLCCAGSIPWNYVRFLNYADAHILLRRIGGGYSFIHPLFLNYFALYATNGSADTPQQVFGN